MALRGVPHGSLRSPSWLCQESVMALKEFVQGRWPCEQPILVTEGIFQLLRLAYASAGDIPSLLISLRATTDSWQSNGGILAEPHRTPGRAMADFWQSNDRLLVEPWGIFQRPRVLFYDFKNLKYPRGETMDLN